MLPYFSIITPVYNTQAYLKQCIESVIAQTYQSWELILIDDGSTDGSGEICDSFCFDSRIRVIHQDNEGALNSRINGIAIAEGEYMLGLDADDYLDRDCLEIVKKAIDVSGSDLIFWGYRMFGEAEGICKCSLMPGKLYSQKEIIEEVIDKTNHSLCNKAIKLHKAKCADYSEIKKRLTINLDYVQIIAILCEIETGYVIDNVLYNYRVYSGSMSHAVSIDKILDIGISSEYVMHMLEHASLMSDSLRKLINLKYLVMISGRIFEMFIYNSNFKEDCRSIYNSNIYIESKEVETFRNFGHYKFTLLKMFRYRQYWWFKVQAIKKRKLRNVSRTNDWEALKKYYLKFNYSVVYVNLIAYYGKKCVENGKSLRKIRKDLLKHTRIRTADKNTIVFIVEYATPRLLKMAYAIKRQGLELQILIKSGISDCAKIISELKLCADVWLEFSSITQLMYQLIHSNAFVAHYFTDWSMPDGACVILQQKQLFMKIVIERYDVFNGMYPDYARYMISAKKYERYAFEHADGVVYREFSGEYLENNLGFKIPGKQLVFLDYFSMQDAVNVKTADCVDKDELSLVYAGGIVTEKEYPDSSFTCFLELADICEENRCHFHVYPSSYDAKRFENYINLDKTSQYFHFHKPVPFVQLNTELSKYDFGILPIRSGFLDFDQHGYNTREKFIYAGTNKFMDYLQAGLPIIAKTPIKLVDELAKYIFVLKWTIEEYDFDKLRLLKEEMKKNVLENRDCFSIEYNTGRLVDFYHSL